MDCKILLVLILQVNVVTSIILNKEAQEYLNGLIKFCNENPTNSIFDYVIPPPIDCPHLPPFFIWAPLEHFNIKVKCPRHPSIYLRGSGWTDDLLTARSNRNPRLVFDLQRNIVLVQRHYGCKLDRTTQTLSGSIEFMQSFPISLSPNHFPFKKYHQSMVSFNLIDYIYSQVIEGVSFFHICRGISAMNYGYFDRCLGQNSEKAFQENVLFSYPSADKIETIFLDTFYSIQHILQNANSLPSTSISIDHTLKLGRGIAGVKNKREYVKLFSILNEDNEIVSWKATKTADQEELMPVLLDLKYKLEITGRSLQYAFVENCCDSRDMLDSLFPGVSVKLDPYHAVAMITNVLPDKNSVKANIFSKELRQIFNQHEDTGDKRQMETASPGVIMHRLIQLVAKQESYLNMLTDNKKQEVLGKIEILKEHIVMGCLSDIPSGMGSDSVEKYHYEFHKSPWNNHAYALSPEIAIAIFAILLATYNSRLSGTKHSCNSRITPYLPKTFLSPFLQAPKEPESLTIDDFALLASGNILTNNLLCRLACNIYYTYNFLKKIKHACVGQDFQCETAVKFMFDTTNSEATLAAQHDHSYPNTDHASVLFNNLKSFNLAKEKVPADGDCLFRSILREVIKKMATVNEKDKFAQHLENIGMKLTETEEDLIMWLRALFVHELKSGEQYKNYMTKEDINDIDSFMTAGVFASNIGDLVVDVCADVLGLPIVVISSLSQMNVSIHLPKHQQHSDSPIYLSYDASASGHYDGTKSFIEQENNDSDIEELRCRCRSNQRGGKVITTCLSHPTYSTRCPCKKVGRPCSLRCDCKSCGNGKPNIDLATLSCRCGQSRRTTEDYKACVAGKKCPCSGSSNGCTDQCDCKNCHNSFGVKPEVVKSATPAKRKRADKSYVRRKTSDFIADGCEVLESEEEWNLQEISALLCCVNLLLRTSTLTVEHVHLVYTSVAESYAMCNIGMRLKKRGIEQVKEKLETFGLKDVFLMGEIS
ncbi:uncharacterized protein LOC130648786 [Hydractinia symbiolongicarpus]|uniref:uncharacterized protein LOC130648786 n=1 Tax=Hydractinia symbiolongicarpus TaxID=13093 RepID=UPI00254C09A2|nr:uncharacterized protein LOC130648786 [Hydractinia symbiolongicarpus]